MFDTSELSFHTHTHTQKDMKDRKRKVFKYFLLFGGVRILHLSFLSNIYKEGFEPFPSGKIYLNFLGSYDNIVSTVFQGLCAKICHLVFCHLLQWAQNQLSASSSQNREDLKSSYDKQDDRKLNLNQYKHLSIPLNYSKKAQSYFFPFFSHVLICFSV